MIKDLSQSQEQNSNNMIGIHGDLMVPQFKKIESVTFKNENEKLQYLLNWRNKLSYPETRW